MERPDFFKLKNGEKVKLPFSNKEYDQRVSKLRSVMDKNNLDMIILPSMHNKANYTGFIYCSFGRPYGCVVTNDKISTISANIDASQPWRRSHCENIIYTDWRRDNFLKAIVSIIGRDNPPKNSPKDPDNLLENVLKVWNEAGHKMPENEDLYWAVKSEIPPRQGLKSSSSVAIAALRALCDATETEVFNSLSLFLG